MYEQSIDQVKVVVLPLDGTILDLNRYRFNYYHHLCESKHYTLDKHAFYSHLSNMYDMYRGLPLSNEMDVGPFNSKVERELYQYLSYKGLKPKEGCLELIEYLHQKNIYIAVISTHRTKDAVQYLQDISLYDQVHFIIGSDTSSMPLPSTQMLETITQHFGVRNEETLVISSFMALNYAANELHMNVIYCEDLVKADMREKETSYKTVPGLFEVLNTFLFDRYEEVEMYSPILGMNATMSKEELDNVKAKLEVTYRNDPQILDLINRTYMYHVSQLGRQNIKDASASVMRSRSEPRKRFQFEDEVSRRDLQEMNTEAFEKKPTPPKEEKVVLQKEEKPVVEEKPKEDKKAKEKKIIESLYDLTPEPTTFIKEVPPEESKPRRFFKENLFRKEPRKEEVKEETHQPQSSPSMGNDDVKDLISVLNQIDQHQVQKESDDTFLQNVNVKVARLKGERPVKESHDEVVEALEEDKIEERTSHFDIRRQIFDDDDDEYDHLEEDSVIMGALINVSSIFAISFGSLFIGVIMYVAFIHQFKNKTGLFPVISFIFGIYQSIIEGTFQFIFDGLHYIIPAVPSYSEYIHNNFAFSPDGTYLFDIFVFQCFLILIVKAILTVVRKRINEKAYS